MAESVQKLLGGGGAVDEQRGGSPDGRHGQQQRHTPVSPPSASGRADVSLMTAWGGGAVVVRHAAKQRVSIKQFSVSIKQFRCLSNNLVTDPQRRRCRVTRDAVRTPRLQFGV